MSESEFEKCKRIYDVYCENSRNYTWAGNILGISRDSVRRYVKRYHELSGETHEVEADEIPTYEKCLEIFEAYQNNAMSYEKTASKLDCSVRKVKRYVNLYHEKYSVISKEAGRTGIPFDNISHYWLKTKNENGDDVSVFVKNPTEVVSYEEIRDKLIEEIKQFSPTQERISRPEIDAMDDHMLVLDPADVHIGKLCLRDEVNYEYNIKLAKEAMISASKNIIDNANSSYKISNICIVVGNDVIHVDNASNTTTRGTKQDADKKYWSMFVAAREAYVEIISYATLIAPVNIIFCPSNHDLVLGFALTDAVYCYFYNNKNVTVTEYGKSPRHRKYMRYGNNLIGFTHGDGAKNKDLASLMQYEARDEWGNAKFSYWYVHHHHHKNRSFNGVQLEKDLVGVTIINSNIIENQENNTQIECVRTPSPPDYWHSQHGYVNSSAIEGFVHSLYNGQVARFTENLNF